jgi:hypothetical protein
MTNLEVAALAEALATVVRDVVHRSLDAQALRMTALETTTAAAIAETRTACLRELIAVRERVAVAEAREPIPGPPGPEGPRGLDGKDGTPGLVFKDKYLEGTTYERGDFVKWNGSGWYCNEQTTHRPGDGSGAWTLFVKNGSFK